MITKLEVQNLFVRFGELAVLDDINITLKKGEFVSVVGPSGCGKSTLFNHIAGLQIPDQGNIFIDGSNVTGKTNTVAYMYQKDLLLPWRKVIDNIVIPLEIAGIPKNQRVNEAKKYLPIFGLADFEDYYPAQLSGGMRQRVALLRTYMCKKDIMLLDEPFGRLDALTKSNMQQWLKDVAARMESSILFITHDIDEAIYLSDRIYVLSQRPAKIKVEITIDLDKTDFIACTTSNKFNQLKAKILAFN